MGFFLLFFSQNSIAQQAEVLEKKTGKAD